jgi:hypothetical protein
LPVPVSSPISSKARKWELKFVARFVDPAATGGDGNEIFDRGYGGSVRVMQSGVRPEFNRRLEWINSRQIDARR